MKEKFIELMEKSLSAYTDEHIQRYLATVKVDGLTEHGFPRLTSNIGILIAHGRRNDLLAIFIEMMDFCCDAFVNNAKAANEFSVREIVCCIYELDKEKAIDEKLIAKWKQKITQIIPEKCYDVVVKEETDNVANWAIFGAVSEYARIWFNLGNNFEFVDRQLSCQFKWLDENSMYRDYLYDEIHQPIVYDIVPRGLFVLLLCFGYRGKYYEKIDKCIKEAALHTLKMQSSNGEIAFGGRSNQFLHNEAWLIIIFEHEAQRYYKEGNLELFNVFKSASARALKVTEDWLNKKPIRHIKNRFPTETKHGCEKYAYFDKYMITVASILYAAYLFFDDSIKPTLVQDSEPVVFQTSKYFHKLFLKSGGYAVEFDTNADPHYDANGLGRIHKDGAPSTICLSSPCPLDPVYTLDVKELFAFSMSSAILTSEGWLFGADKNSKYQVIESKTDKKSAFATLLCSFSNGKEVKEDYIVNENGVSITVDCDGDIGYTLPAFLFDGENYTKIVHDNNTLQVLYEGWACKYITSGKILDLNKVSANRNGHYKAFIATSKDTLNVKVEITKI